MMKQENIRIRMFVLMLGLFLSVGAFAQIEVKGHVKDAQGEPVIGATVRVVGTQIGTVTDFDGNFMLKAQSGADISVTYVGYQETTVKAAPSLEITMQDDATTLNDVVVIGYGRARKTDLTGSVTAIKPDDKNHGLNVNAQDMISGKIAGVSVISGDGRPGGGAQIRIRGGSSLNASNDPLIVIDGLAMDNYGVKGLANPLSMVNPNDIESFTVLKDASATAIYGSRASNGVIIITTKKGRTNQKPTFNYSGNVSIATKRNTLDVLDGPAYVDFIRNLYGENSSAFKALGYVDANGNKQYANTNWQDEIYRTAVSTDHNLTMSGGLKNMPYRVSLGYTNQQGILKTDKFERFTASFSVNPSFLDDHLKFNINGKGMIAKNRYADGGAVGSAVWMDPTKPVKADNPIYNNYFDGYAQWYSKAEFDGGANWEYTKNSNATANPVGLLDQKDDRATSKSLMGNIEADYAVHGFEDLHFHVNAAMDLSTGEQDTDISRYSATNNYYGYTGWSSQDSYNLQLSMYAQYMKDFAKIHHFDIMAGYEWQHFHRKGDWSGYGLNPLDNTKYPGVKNDPHPAEGEITESKSENYLVSFFGRLNYTLMDRYMLTFTLRADGSSRFNWMKGNDNQQWGYFPALALAWRMKEESFLKNIDFLSDAKLRLGWGITGQQEGIGDYTYIPTFTPNTNNHALYPVLGNGTTYRPDAFNPKLTWEKTTTWNAGIDLGFGNGLIEMSLDWYYRKTKDLINTVYVAAGSNFRNKITSNIGSLHNTGFEAMLTARPIRSKDWQWEVTYNFTYNRNKIDELISGEGDDYFVETGGGGTGTGGTVQAHTVGQAASSFHVYQQVYDQNGNPIPNTFVDRNGNGYLDSGDKYYYYKPAADVLMGLSSKVQYKNWDLGFSMRASLGNYVYNNVAAGGMNVGSGAVYSLGFLGNRQVEAVNRGFTNPTEQQYYSDYFVENASFLKMDNITLGYSFDKIFGAPIGGRVYATVQNVFTITKYKGLDPEVASGIGGDMYPRPITTIIGASLNF